MRYFKEIESMLVELFREKWMDDSDWEEFKVELQKQGVNYETMNKQLEKGVENGYSIDFQINSCKQILQILKIN